MDFYKQYPSGLRLVAKRLDHLYTVTVGVFVDVGSVKETAENNGYSHFIEHLLFKGTKKRTSLQISEAIDDIGASINAYTSKDNTCFYTKSASDDLEVCLDVLSDMYFNSTFPQDELDRERGVVLEEINMCDDTPDDVCSDLVAKALFFHQSLGQTILGNPENIKYSDKHSIENFKEKYYVPSGTVVSVCGKFDFDELDKLIEKYFEACCGKEKSTVEIEPNVEYTSKVLKEIKSINQAHVQLGWGGYPFNSPRSAANAMLASILGGGMTSRLYQSVREKNGLAYSVYSYPSSYLKAGTFEIYVGMSPENCVKTCKLIKDEIDKMLNDGVTETELSRAKIQAVNSLYMAVENPMTLMRLYGRSLLKYGDRFSIERDVERYKSVTLSDINLVARDVLTGRNAASYVGPDGVFDDLKAKLSLR